MARKPPKAKWRAPFSAIDKRGGAHVPKPRKKPKRPKEDWDGDQYYDNFIDGSGR